MRGLHIKIQEEYQLIPLTFEYLPPLILISCPVASLSLQTIKAAREFSAGIIQLSLPLRTKEAEPSKL